MVKRISILAVLLLAFLLTWFFPALRDMVQQRSLSPEAIKEMDDGAYTVSLVIDGNTLELIGGEKVRLIGVKPTEGAADFIREAAFGEVGIEQDVQKYDKDGAMLAYVSYQRISDTPTKILLPNRAEPLEIDRMEGVMLNTELIKAGYAQADITPPNVKYQELLMDAEKEAREQKRGLWR